MSLSKSKTGNTTARRSNASRSAPGRRKAASMNNYNDNRSRGGNKTGRGKPAASARGNNSR